MSVLLNIDKPKKCFEMIDGHAKKCPILRDDDCCPLQSAKIQNKVKTWEQQYEYCPLHDIGKTNGDVIKSLFPDYKTEIDYEQVICFKDDNNWLSSHPDWWNGLYKEGVK